MWFDRLENLNYKRLVALGKMGALSTPLHHCDVGEVLDGSPWTPRYHSLKFRRVSREDTERH